MLKQFIPTRLKDAVKVLCGVAQVAPISTSGSSQTLRICPVCRQSTEFSPLPYRYTRTLVESGYVHSLFDAETMNFDEYSCRRCGSADRDRLFALYFGRTWQGPGTILEIAPRAALTTFLRHLPQATVRTADLFDPSADDKVDLTNMDVYGDAQFDAWICSHVLEHIPDDRKAIRELYRVLKPGGWGIVMVPIVLSVRTTHEDSSITDPALRRKYFGQDDHVRLYAKADFIQRLEKEGFNVAQVDGKFFGPENCERAGIDVKSVLYIAKKPAL